MQTEQPLYRDEFGNFVSPTRAILSGTTYAIANVTSIRYSERSRPVATIVFFAVLTIVFAISKVYAMCGFLALATLFIYWKFKPMAYVIVGTTAGEKPALISTDTSKIKKIVAALNQAIIEK